MNTITSKTATTSKRIAGTLRSISGATKISNDLAVIIDANAQTSTQTKSLKVISEVDGNRIRSFLREERRFYFYKLETNIDEVLSLTDLSRVPTSFLTEIQQDKVYGTILQELQKKRPHRTSSTPSPPAIVLSKDEEKAEEPGQTLSPHLLVLENENDDDDESLIDDVSSTVSSINNVPSLTDGYDTDIESGDNTLSSFIFRQTILFFRSDCSRRSRCVRKKSIS